MAVYNPEKDNEPRYMTHFIKEEYLKSFLDGSISLAHFSFYKNPDKDISGRNDINEGVISINTPDKVQLSFAVEHEFGASPPKEEFQQLLGLTGLIKFHVAENYDCHLFCCAAVNNYSIGIAPELAGDRSHFVVFRNPKDFIKRLDDAALAQGLGFRSDYVEYIEINDHPTKEHFFYKMKEFSYQKEIRMGVYGHKSKDRITLNVGDIRKDVELYRLYHSSVK